MRISDWSSDVCSSDLHGRLRLRHRPQDRAQEARGGRITGRLAIASRRARAFPISLPYPPAHARASRLEEHTSEFPSLMRTSYAVFFLNKKNKKYTRTTRLIAPLISCRTRSSQSH